MGVYIVLPRMPIATSSVAGNGGSAPSYGVPAERIVSIEHPCIVKNFSNGFKSLGGEQQLKHVSVSSQTFRRRKSDLTPQQVLENELGARKSAQEDFTEPVAGVSLRPNDPFAKKLSSTGVETQNVLIKVTVPKRTGRKRKRGSDDPFTETPSTEKHNDCPTAPELLQRLRDNAEQYSMQAVGVIRDTHRFRDLPDFQVQANEVPLMRVLRDHAMQPDYDGLKAFRIDAKTSSNANSACLCPPSFVATRHSYHHENTKPKTSQSKGVGRAPVPSTRRLGLSIGTDKIPQGPPDHLAEPSVERIPNAIAALKDMLEERPIISKRAFHSMRPGHSDTSLKQAVPYVGYYINTGPWRYTMAKYGVDPREDPKFRIYQTITLSHKGIKAVRKLPSQQSDTTKMHVFDGKEINGPGNMWQLCDVTHPTLQQLVQTENIRKECELQQWGWYLNGTMSKIRWIMRCMMFGPLKSDTQIEEEDYRILAALPDSITEHTDCDLALRDHPHLQLMGKTIASDARYRKSETAEGDEEEEAEQGEAEPGTNGEHMAVGDEDEDGDYVNAEVGAEEDDDDGDGDYVNGEAGAEIDTGYSKGLNGADTDGADEHEYESDMNM